MTIRAVLFDIGDTLWALDPLPQDLDLQMAQELTVHVPAAGDQALGIVRSALAAAREAAGDGTHREPDLACVIQEHSDFAGVPVSDDAASSVAAVLGRADVERIRSRVEPARLFGALRAQGLRIGLLSNTWTHSRTLSAFVERERALAHVHAATFSSAERLRKPHPDLYRLAVARLGVEVGETLFVGDRVVEDVVGPQQAGMLAVLTHEHRQESSGEARPLAVIVVLVEVHRLVAQLNTASGE